MYSHRERERRVRATQGLIGNAITVCLGAAFLNSLANFTAILESQQVISNHNDALMFSHGAEHPLCGFILWPFDPSNHLQAI